MNAPATDATPLDLAAALRERTGDERVLALESADGMAGAFVPPELWCRAATVLRDELGFTRFIDLTSVDTMADEGRFAIHLVTYALEQQRWARLKTAASDEVDSLGEVFAAAEPYEREVFDLFGVRFRGHPSLTRLLLPDEWRGHPLRRDHPLVEEPVEFVTTGTLRGSDG